MKTKHSKHWGQIYGNYSEQSHYRVVLSNYTVVQKCFQQFGKKKLFHRSEDSLSCSLLPCSDFAHYRVPESEPREVCLPVNLMVTKFLTFSLRYIFFRNKSKTYSFIRMKKDKNVLFFLYFTLLGVIFSR